MNFLVVKEWLSLTNNWELRVSAPNDNEESVGSQKG